MSRTWQVGEHPGSFATMIQSEHIGVMWAKAQAAAAWTGDPERWRRELAEALRLATGTSFAAVYTCPPISRSRRRARWSPKRIGR